MSPITLTKAFGHALAIASALAVLAPAGAGATAPDPGGDERAVLSGPPAGKSFGFNDAFLPGGLGAPAVATMTRAVGGNAVRMPIRWQGLEQVRDVWNEVTFAQYTLAYTQYVAAGITPHLSITHAPPWARDAAYRDCTDKDWCNYPPAPEMLGEWEEFLAELARRYPRATLEVWNEPNFVGSWRSGVDPARYAQLLKRAYDSVKAVSPSTEVLAGGLGSSVKPNSLGVRQFLEGAYAASPSIKGHMDALNLHIYPGAKLGENSLLAHILQDIRAVRTQYGDEATPIFVTETGATTTGPDAVGEDAQADIVMRATRKLLTMPDVSGVLVSRLLEDPTAPADDNERGLGINRVLPLGGTAPKLAFCALTRAAAALDALCPPETSIDAGPPELTNSSAATVAFSSPDSVAGFECSLDGGSFTACTSPRTFSGLPDGSHIVEVRARDTLLRVDPFPAAHEFVVDTTPPQTSLEGPTGPSRETEPLYLLSSEYGAAFECSLDGSTFAPCSSPYRPGPLGEGVHEVRSRAVDPAGNPDPTPESASIDVDRTAPETTLTRVPERFEQDASPVVEFASTESGSFECALDSWEFTPCSSPRTLASLPDGDHAFRVLAVDLAGNGDPTPAATDFTVDTRGPTVTVTSGPDPFENDPTPSFHFTADEAITGFACRVDSWGFAPCASGYTPPTLSQGPHRFEVRATDKAGNQGAAAASSFTIDVAPPETSLTRAPARFERDSTPTVEFSATEAGATFQCALDSWDFAPCASPRELGPLGDGDHAFRVRAVDGAGNVDATAAYSNFTTDTSAPTVAITSGPTGPTTNNRPSFSFTVDDPAAGAECQLETASFGPCSGARSHQPSTALGDGAYSLRVRATDRAGNVSAVAVRSFAVDRTAPAAPAITSLPGLEAGEPVNLRDVWFEVARESGGSALCQMDGADYTPCASPQPYSGLAEGGHGFAAKSVDAAGNVSAAATLGFRVDLTAPETSITSGPSKRTRDRRPRFQYASNDPEAGFQCSVDGGRFSSCPSPHRLRRLQPGRHRLQARAIDRAGNVDGTPAAARFRILR